MLFELPAGMLGPNEEGARDWNQLKQDQVSGVHFGHIYPLFDSIRNLKKLTNPIDYMPHVQSEWASIKTYLNNIWKILARNIE